MGRCALTLVSPSPRLTLRRRARAQVCGSDDMFIRVFNYNTMEKVKEFVRVARGGWRRERSRLALASRPATSPVSKKYLPPRQRRPLRDSEIRSSPASRSRVRQ